MTAYVPSANNIGPTLAYNSIAAGDSVTFLQGLTFISTTGNAVQVFHANNTVMNMTTLMSGNGYGIVVNGGDGTDISNTATGTIGTLASLGGYLGLYVTSNIVALQNDGTIFSSNGSGASFTGNGNSVSNRGIIRGLEGGISMAGSGISVVNAGTIEAGVVSGGSAVYFNGSGFLNTLVNSGLIEALSNGGTAVNNDSSGNLVLINSGTIRALQGTAIDASSSGGLSLTNTGTISSSTLFSAAVSGSLFNDTIINSGSINRAVFLADGQDIFDGRGGRVDGLVFGGTDNDTFIISDAATQVFEAAGEGVADVLRTWGSYALEAGNEIEIIILEGTAADASGNEFANQITGNIADNRLFGNAGVDVLNGQDGNDLLDGGTGADSQLGGEGDDRLMGRSGNDTLSGDAGDDWLVGGADNDSILGGEGEDTLIGGAGRDIMAGGADADTFVWRAVTDSGVTGATHDQINGFQAGFDTLDLSNLDAVAGLAGNQDFAWLGNGAFTGVAGQLRWFVSGANVIVEGTVNADLVADFQIRLNGLAALQVDDVIL